MVQALMLETIPTVGAIRNRKMYKAVNKLARILPCAPPIVNFVYKIERDYLRERIQAEELVLPSVKPSRHTTL
jgi:hypothetical protein